MADQADPLKAAEELTVFGGAGLISMGAFKSSATGPLSGRLSLSPYMVSQAFGAAPSSPTTHSLAIVARATCRGGGSGITGNFAGVDLIANDSI
jgi:hypothetical protein